MKIINVLLLGLLLTTSLSAQKTFTLLSQDVGEEGTLKEEFDGCGCTGKNQSPQLSWINAPEDTKSFAVTMYGSRCSYR